MGKRCEQKVKDISCIVEQVYKLAYSYNQLTVATDLLNRIAPVTTGQVKTSIKRVTKLGKSIDQLESILNGNIKELKELYNDGCCDYECEEICVECCKNTEFENCAAKSKSDSNSNSKSDSKTDGKSSTSKEEKAIALKSLQETSKMGNDTKQSSSTQITQSTIQITNIQGSEGEEKK